MSNDDTISTDTIATDNVIAFPSRGARVPVRHDHRRRRGGDHPVPRSRSGGPRRDAALLAAVLMMLGATENREEIPGLAARLNAEIDPETLREVLVEASGRIGDMVCLCIEDQPVGRG
jgi:hypothetical protein